MDYETFVGDVQNRAQLSSREDAVRVSRITLESLSERIDPGLAENLGAQLPEEIGRHLEKVDDVEQFSWDEFVDRVEEKGDYGEGDRGEVVHHARVVMDVVDDAITGGALNDARDQLPPEYEELFALVDQEETPVEEDQRPE